MPVDAARTTETRARTRKRKLDAQAGVGFPGLPFEVFHLFAHVNICNSTRPHLPHPSLHTSSTRRHCSLRNSRSRRITSLSHGRSCPSPSQWCPDASSSRFRFRRRRETPITLNIAFVTRGENPFPAITCPTLNFASGSLSCAYPMAQRFSAGVHTRLSVGCIAHPCIPSGLDFFVGDLAGLSNRCRRYTRFPMAVKFSSKRSTPCTFRMDCGIVA